MPLLIDQLRNQHALHAPDKEPKRSQFIRLARSVQTILSTRSLPVITIQNVADFFWTSEKFQDWSHTDFPNVAPPFEFFWMEYRHPTLRLPVGILFISDEVQKTSTNDTPVKWELHAAWAIAIDDVIQFPAGVIHFPVSPEGSITGRILIDNWWDSSVDILKENFYLVDPAMLAISFMHCKNVQLSDNRIDKPLAKKWHARYNKWPSPYKTLIIEPMQQILRKEGHSDTIGLKLAMHICRGHFRDYREGPGLFGKHHVMVWQPSIIRGTVRYDEDECAPPREIEIKSPKR